MTSSWHVWRMYIENPITVATSVGAARVFKYMGLLVVGGSGTAVAIKSLSYPGPIMNWFNAQLGVHLDAGTSDEDGVITSCGVVVPCVVGAIISFGVAAQFMEVVDMAAESLAYCILWK